MQPVREVDEAVVHRDDDVGDQARDRERPAFELDALDRDGRIGGPRAVRPVPAPEHARERGSHVALSAVRIVQRADLERDQPLVAEVDRLRQLALLEVPEMEAAAVAAGADVLEVEAGLVRVRLAELRRDERVLAREVPEVVVERRRRAAVLPPALDLERLRVEHGEAARAAAVGVAEHADDDVVARHAVHGVRARVAGLREELVRLDHLLDARAARIVGDVQHVDARRPEAGEDQVRAVGPVARRAAPVPAEVVELVADVRHRRLVDDLPVLGVDDGQKVRRVDARALVQAGEVEKLLGRRLRGLRGGAEEGRGAVRVHGSPPWTSA